MKASLVFLAAGFGSRFQGGIKQLAPVGPNGEVLMDYAVHDGLQAGFDRVVFIIRRDLEREFRDSVGRRIERKCDVEYVFQALEDLPRGFSVPAGRTKPWGTGQAVLACRNVVHEPFCVLNADDFYGAHAYEQVYESLSALKGGGGLLCSMAGYVLGNTLSESGGVTRGLCHADENGRLQSIEEVRGIELRDGAPCVERDGVLHRLDGSMPVSMNMWGLPPEFMDYLAECFPIFLESLPEGDGHGEFLLPTIIGGMVAQGRGSVQVLTTHEKWFGMTYAQDRAQAREYIAALVEQGKYPAQL